MDRILGQEKKEMTELSAARASKVSTGLSISWGAQHRDTDGNLISRQASIEPPAAPTCLTPACLWHYFMDSLYYALLCSYEARRTAYAEENRNKVILERYRTGEPFPQNIWQAIHANIKLKCPICRKYDVDPLLFRR